MEPTREETQPATQGETIETLPQDRLDCVEYVLAKNRELYDRLS